MRKLLLLLTGFLFVGALVFMSAKVYTKSRQNMESKLARQTLPAFEFYTLDSLAVSSSIAGHGKPVCLVYFDPECPHCESETREITSHLQEFGDAQILMVSANTPEKIAAFAQEFSLARYPTVQVLWDKEHLFYKWFGNAIVPSVYIYNKEQQLVKEYFGEVKAEAIIRHLH